MARKAITTRRRNGVKGKKNLDPLSTMALAQGTGLDRVVLGKRGFGEIGRALSGRRNGRNPEDIEFLNDAAPYPSLGHVEFTQDGIERYVRDGYVYQAFTTTPVFGDGFRMGTPEATVNDFAMQNPAKYDRCVKAVQSKGGANGYAVCMAEGLRDNPKLRLRAAMSRYFDGTSKVDAALDEWLRKYGEEYLKLTDLSDPTRTQTARIKAMHRAIERFRKEGAQDFGGIYEVKQRFFKNNPRAESDAVYESFHGVPPSETLEVHETEHVHEHLAGLGDLVCLVVVIASGSKAGSKRELIAPDPGTAQDVDIVRVACNESRNQIYFVSGDQSIDVKKLGFRESFNVVHDGEEFEATDLRDLMMIGEVCKLTYRTQKEFDGFSDIDYFHKLGEDTKTRPFLLYDTLNQRMRLAGGEYVVHAVGIVN